MKCQFCNQELPEKAKFCYKCKSQLVCKECGEKLLQDADICVFCGVEIPTTSKVDKMNVIEYSRNEIGEKFSARFSDTTAGNVVQTFAELRTPNIRTISQPQIASMSIIEDVEINSSTTIPTATNTPAISTSNTSIDLTSLNKIFINKNGDVFLHEKRLKSETALEQSYKLALLFLLYKTLNNEEDVKRSELNSILSKENLHLGNFRTWLSKNKKYFIQASSDVISLSPEGMEKAQAILSEVFDVNIKGSWTPTGSKTITTTISNKTTNNKLPKIVKDLNLVPSGKDSLKEFMTKYKYQKSNPEICLLFIYYLTKICGLKNINQDHLYTCYKETSILLPNNLYQCLADAARRKGWFENVSDLNVTIQGENKVEHNMKKK